jgi:hypothetical protein
MLSLPYWPFVVSFVVRIDLIDMPLDMCVTTRDRFNRDWEWGARLELDSTIKDISEAFTLALGAFHRNADRC